MGALAATFLASVASPASAGAELTPIAHLDASADVVWVTENVPGGPVPDTVSVTFGHIEVHAVDVDPRTGVFPPGPDEVYANVRGRTSTRGSIEVTPLGVTLTASDGQVTSRYLLRDGGEPGTAPTGPVGKGGYAPTLDYIQDLQSSPGYYVRGWVLSGYIRLTYVTPDPSPPDTTPPVTSIACDGASCSGSVTGAAGVSMSATDNGGSGVAATRYTTDGSEPTTSSPLYTYPFTLTQTTTVRYRSWDNSGNVESTKTQTITITPAPPSGGGGGGGGGGGVPDLIVSLSASTTAPASGGESDLVATVTNTGTQTSTGTHLVIALPATMTLLGPPAFDRGSGCSGSQPVDCNLDFLPVGVTTRVIFAVRVDGQGTITATASGNTEANPADNTATVTLEPQRQAPLAPPVVPAAPLKPVLGKPSTVPLRPRSGKRFVLTLPVKRSDTGALLASGRLVCNPSVAGRAIKHSESFRAGKARLSLLVPKTAKGTLLSIKLEITFAGKTATRTVSYGVR